jgi:hypothetical protein
MIANPVSSIARQQGRACPLPIPAVVLVLAFLFLGAALPCPAGNLDTMGVTRLRANDPTLTGSGISVAQAEAQNDTNINDWEVNPPNAGQTPSLFTWINTNGSSASFPNSLGLESSHADQVGNIFYGSAAGVAPAVLHVDNYEADYFIASNVYVGVGISGKVVNQSFTFGYLTVSHQQSVDSSYDDYVAANGTLFCSAVNNGGHVCAPGTDYNCIGVGCYGVGANSSTGPTVDNGRCKPDIVAPSMETSFSTPCVAGAATVLLQAAARGDGGANTSAAGDARAIKALLLNGAIKPGDWSHTTNSPLDPRYGAGVLNLFYSHQQLAAGQQPFSVSQTIPAGGPHPPGTNRNDLPSPLGWDFQTIASSPAHDVVNHYYFDSSTNPAAALTLTATLVWNRAAAQTNINQLALFLYNSANSNLVAASVSAVDNVQHLYLPSLARGQYDMQVVKYGGASEVSPSETYALAYQFYPISPPLLHVSLSGTNVMVSWPWTPTVFNLQQTTNLAPFVSWNPVAAVGLITNTTVLVTLSPIAAAGFYQLSR